MFLASAYLGGILSSAVELRHLRYFGVLADHDGRVSGEQTAVLSIEPETDK